MLKRGKNLSFTFKGPETAGTTLGTLRCATQACPDVVTKPIQALDACAEHFATPIPARDLAQELGRGSRDLLVVLLEPTEIWSTQTFEEAYQHSWALQKVDEELRYASHGQRTLRNTCVIDVRPFRSASVRGGESDYIRAKHDEEAYSFFEDILEELTPHVVIVAQCQTKEVDNQLARRLCSQLHSVADSRVETFSGLEFLVVNSFHPSAFAEKKLIEWSGGSISYLKRTSAIDMRRTLLELAFKLSFLVALNALAGRKIVGFGTLNVQASIQHNGPIARIGRRQGETCAWITFEHYNEDDVSSKELLELPTTEEQQREAQKLEAWYKKMEAHGRSLA